MLRKIFIVAILTFTWGIGLTQDLKSVTWIGYQGQIPVFSYYNDGYRDLYTLNESKLSFSLLEENRIQSKYEDYFVSYYYVEGSFRRYSVPKIKDTFPFAFELDGNFEIIEIPFNPRGTGYDLKNKKVYLGNQTDNPDLHESLPIHQLDIESGELKKLPIKGVSPVVLGEYLFYADYPDPKQFDLVYDIYRVKIGEWQNPEKVFQDNYMNGWKVSADGKYLLTELIEYGHKPQKVVYSIEEKKYSTIEQQNLPNPVFYSINKEAFCFYDIGLYNDVKRRFIYVDIPKTFTYTPSWAMDFGDTFITTYLLEEAGEDELRKLEKSQLRLLRNAIFARKGWHFKDKELTAFFNQLNWYPIQTKKYYDNSEIKLTNNDKYRAKLIQKIEQRK